MTGKDGRTASTQPHAVGLGAGKDRKSSGSGGPLRRAAPAAVAVLTYCVVAAAAYWPVSPVSSSRIMVCGCHDAAQEAWFLAWPLFAITHSHSLFFSNWIGYPSGVNLAANTSMPLLGVLGAPVTALAGPVASYNFLLRLSFAASASSAFFVLRRWAPFTPAAFAGGLLYGFSPYMVGEGLGHVFLVFVPLPPLIFFSLERLFVGPRRPAWQQGAVLGGLAVLQFFISAEVLLTTALIAAIGTAVAVALRPRAALTRARHALGGLGCAAGMFAALAGYPIWFYLRGAQRIVGPSHSVSGLAPYHADLLSVVVPSQSERLAPFGLWAVGNRLTGYNVTETGAYIGIPLLVLLIVLVVRNRDETRIRCAAGLALVAYVLSLGASLEVDGADTHIPLPFAVIQRIPVLQGASAGRFSLYTAFFIAVIVAVGLDRERLKISGRYRARRRALLVGIVAGCCVPLLPSFPYHEVSTDVPAYFTSAAVDAIPAGSVVLAYPYPYTPDDDAMLWESVAGMRFRIIGGQAAIPGKGGLTTSAPETLQPTVAEALFLDAMYGTPRIEPRPPPLDATTLARLREFCARYDVGTIVVDPLGENPKLVGTYLTAALRAPPEHEGGVEVWYHVESLAAAAAALATGTRASP